MYENSGKVNDDATNGRALCSSILIVLIGLVHLMAEFKDKATNPTGTPVLVELFTSEGCLDCPPADALLESLDKSQPVAGAQPVVLSEHLDYWNHIGWKDPYSSRAYCERQGAYAARFGLSSVYTPQMVVDGKFESLGSNEGRAIAAAETALQAQPVSIKLSGAHMESDGVLTVHLDAGRLPSPAARPTNVLLAVADERDETHVTSGENGGRTLTHCCSPKPQGGGFAGSVERPTQGRKNRTSSSKRKHTAYRFCSRPNAGTIRGVASISFSK